MNIKILTHLMPWEIDYALLSFSQLKKSEKFISDEINIEFSSVLKTAPRVLSDF